MVSGRQIHSRYDDPANHASEYPPDWDERRRAVYRRDDYTCQNCGVQSGPDASGNGVPLHAHHVVPKSKGGSNRLENLQTLCESCHNRAHDHDITEPSGETPRNVNTGNGTITGSDEPSAGLELALVLTFPFYLGSAVTTLSMVGLYGGEQPMPTWLAGPVTVAYLLAFAATPAWSFNVAVGWVGLVLVGQLVLVPGALLTPESVGLVLVGVGVPLAIRAVWGDGVPLLD
jgi:hypothetical protein